MLDRDIEPGSLEDITAPELFLRLRLAVQMFDDLAPDRKFEFAPTGHQVPQPISRNIIRSELDEIGIDGDLREETLKRVKLCDQIHLEKKLGEIETKIRKENAKRRKPDR